MSDQGDNEVSEEEVIFEVAEEESYAIDYNEGENDLSNDVEENGGESASRSDDGDEDDEEQIEVEQATEEIDEPNEGEDPGEDANEDEDGKQADINNMEEREAEDKDSTDEVYQWSAFTGLRVKQFGAEELELFRKPFDMGWKREVVLRGTVTNSGKKIGDVYYFSSDKKTKLRSYVEMGLFLKKNPNCGLKPENFTFARQPIYRPPEEIVRHAMQRGGVQQNAQPQIIDSTPFTPAKAAKVSDDATDRSTRSCNSTRNSTASESEEQTFAMSIAEGRAKRKRVAPSRFEDEDYSESSPFKKKTKEKPATQPSNATQKQTTKPAPPPIPKVPMTLQEKRRHLQHQLLQQVHQQQLAKQEQERAQLASSSQSNSSTNVSIINTTSNSTAIASNKKLDQIDQNETENIENHKVAPITEAERSQIAKKAINTSGQRLPVVKIRTSTEAKEEIGIENEKPLLPQTAASENKEKVSINGQHNQEEQPVPPCSIMCGGRRGMLPNLLCSRCLCLFHLDCVPGGVFLKDPHVFVCPNCLRPEDTQEPSKESSSHKESNLVTINGTTNNTQEVHVSAKIQGKSQVSNTPIMIHSNKRSYAPILPKPASQAYNLQHSTPNALPHRRISQNAPLSNQSHFHTQSSYSGMNVKLPAGTQLYRVASEARGMGHNQFKKKSKHQHQHQKERLARKNIAPLIIPSSVAMPRIYQPAPIAPIAPIKITPAQIRALLQPRPKRGYRKWMQKRKSGSDALLAGFECTNQILSYINTLDLLKLRQVNRTWHKLSSQPFLWKEIKLRGVFVKDWNYLGRNIIEMNGSVDVDFEGMRCGSSPEDICDTYRNFSNIIDYLKSVKRLRFGTIPTFVLQEIINAAVLENCYNSFTNLEVLIVKNLFDEEVDLKSCHLNFLEDFGSLSQLKLLHLQSKYGFAAEENSSSLLHDTFASLVNLESLILPSLKGFSSYQFAFFSALKNLKKLEIGSCENWSKELAESKGNCELNGAFKSLSELTELNYLRLIDVIFDENNQLPQAISKLTKLNSLVLENVNVEESSEKILDELCLVAKALPLKFILISSNDPNTNKCVLDLVKKLDGCEKIVWKVEALVEDSGECLVPLRCDENSVNENAIDPADSETGINDIGSEDSNLKIMDMSFLNELLQSELSNTVIEIVPQ